MREYELMAVYDLAVIEEGGQDASVQHLTSLVERNGGSVTEVDHWGRRRLAYPMNKQLDADFIVTRIELDPQAVKPLNADFEIEERVYRHLVVRADELPPPRPVLAPAGSRGPGSPTGPRVEGAPGAPAAPAAPAPAVETAPAPPVEAAPAPDAEATSATDVEAAPTEAAPAAEAEAPAVEAEAPPVEAEAPAVEAGDEATREAPAEAAVAEEAPAAEAEAAPATEEEAAPAPEAGAEEAEPQADDDTAKE